MGDLTRAGPPPRRIVITGGSSGLGRSLALSYAASGVALGLIGRNVERLTESARACRALGASVETAALDVGEAEPLETWLQAFDAAGAIDLLIANAGASGGPQGPGLTDGLALAARLVRTNLLGVIHAVESVAPGMVARGSGRIAVVSSTAAYRGIPFMPAYAASKAGVRVYGDALRAQLEPTGVTVSVVIPSFFDSPMTDRFHGDKPLLISAEAAAARVRRGIDRGEARIVFPRRIGLIMQAIDALPARTGDAILRRNRFRIDNP